MEFLFATSVTLASILSALTADDEPVSQTVISSYINPAIAGQWQIELESLPTQNQSTQNQSTQSQNVKDQLPPPPTNATQAQVHLQETQQIRPLNGGDSSTNNPQQSNSCRELYNFAADNIMWAVSGKEWTYGKYIITYPDKGLPIIAMSTLYDNNEVDCSGNQVDQTGDAMLAFLKHQGNHMQWCSDPEGTDCFMSFHRILP